jgi:hypothetical protein
VLDGVKAGTLGEHPAGKDSLHLAGELYFVNLDEGGGARLLRRRAAVAYARRHLERAELHRVVDGNLKMRNPPGDLVEGGEDGDRVLDDFGRGCARLKQPGKREA